MKTLVVAMVAVAGTGWGLLTQQPQSPAIDEVKPASPEGIVTIRIPDGTVIVEGWNRHEVAVRGTRATERDVFDFHVDHGHTEISLTPHRGADVTGETHLTIHVPAGSSVAVHTDGAAVDVRDVRGMVRLESGSGHLSVEGAPAGIVAVSQRGDIDIRAPHVRGVVHSEDGKVRLHGGRSGDIVTTREAHRARQMARIRSHRWDGALYGPDWETSLAQLRDLIVVERWNGGMDIRIADAIDIGLDLDALEAMLESIGAEIEDGMEHFAEALARWERADRRRERRSGR